MLSWADDMMGRVGQGRTSQDYRFEEKIASNVSKIIIMDDNDYRE